MDVHKDPWRGIKTKSLAKSQACHTIPKTSSLVIRGYYREFVFFQNLPGIVDYSHPLEPLPDHM